MISQQLYLDVATARDRESFERRLVAFAERMGFPLISAVLVIDRPGTPATFISVGNVPAAYEASYSDPELSQQSPVLSRLKHYSRPIAYDQALYVQDGVGHLWEHQASFGYRTGVAMAAHMDRGRHFLLGVDRPDPLPTEDGELVRMMADLQLLGAYAQETAVRLLTPLGPAEEEVPVLSPRELEILQWTSVGKSAEVVGEILGINRGTVNYHLQSVCRKLGVASKYVAVTQAIRLGLL